MITMPTVFILGAGASKPYGYPTGSELKNIILRNLEGEPISGYSSWSKLGFEASDLQEFRDALFYSGKTELLSNVVCGAFRQRSGFLLYH